MAVQVQEGTGAGSPVDAAQPIFGHEPEDAWFGRLDTGETGDTRRVHQIVRRYDSLRPGAEPGMAVLMGFACDAGVHRNQGRPGAVDGPRAVRRMLANLAVDGFDTVLDAGDIACRDGGLEIAQQVYADAVQRLLTQELRPVLLGGGHEIAWGSFMGLRGYLDAREDRGHVLVLNLDAHLDLRTSRPASSGTPFDQIARHCEAHGLPWRYACLGVSRPNNTAVLFERAREIGAVVVADEAMQERNLEALRMQVCALLEAADHVYLTIDLDVLPGAVAPGVSAPAALGVPLAMVEAVVEWVCVSGKLRLADLAELNPALDRDGQTARVAARLAWRLLRGMSRQAGAARQESFF